MKLGFMPALEAGLTLSDGRFAADLARTVEAAGGESLWAVEHVVLPDSYGSTYPYDATGRMHLRTGYDLPDPLDWLTWAAAATTTLRVGTGILILPEHNPVLLAKRAATIDALSGGRLMLGVGVGWLAEEYEAVGVPFAARGRRADDCIRAMRALWGPGPSTYFGEFTSFRDVHCLPRPVQPGGVPVIVGGHSPAAARRAARLGQGLFPLGLGVDELADLLALLRREAADAGRDPAELEVTFAAPRGLGDAERLAELGVGRLVLSTRATDLRRVGERIETYRAKVVEQLG